MADTRLRKQHPLEAILIEMVEMNRRKSADYASPDNLLQNFDRVAEQVPLDEYDAFMDTYTMTMRKMQRLRNLMEQDIDPQNESVRDTLIDNAVYAVLMVVAYDRKVANDGSVV
ncbi:MAG: hypothetical protein E6Q97_10355 [Desulfurellales bacterium]|nr:MAG: hypothetical protein E6Q97_10355 [Desulfurellales bacterium]